ncbi:lysophospholipase [Caulobacter zeae]|uniref:Lysophospholipase n=1 Tax=Caulobacter zeae TaxID=2055137 RepID=A0A2N5DB45_9CAUL|nr:alpha/beta hydrolase [Caulobacter zeae]PLR23281.1 lysophospholipase [Caulobacter zeae]
MNRRSLLLTVGASGLAAACAPITQRPALAPLGLRGARLQDDWMVAFDGAKLGLKRWLPQDGQVTHVVVGLHGMNDYSNAYHLAADWWAGQGIATYALDLRGFGRSPRRGVWASTDLMIEDVRTLVSLAREAHPGAKVSLAGVSMGGGLAIAAMATDNPPAADSLLLFAPAVWGWSAQPLPYKTSLWISAHTARSWVVKPPEWLVQKVLPTDNMEELRRMGRDPLMIWGARSDTLYGLVGLMERAWASLGKVRVPVAYFYGARDEIIPEEPTKQAARRLKPDDRSAFYANGYHLLLVDKQAEVVWRDAAAFLKDPQADLPSGAPPIPGAPTAPNVVKVQGVPAGR